MPCNMHSSCSRCPVAAVLQRWGLVQVLGIGVVNILGLWAVLEVLQISKDSEWQVAVVLLVASLQIDVSLPGALL